jgi:hypothetical protein
LAQLAQAYVHLKPYHASDRNIRSLGRYAKRVAIKAASEIYGGDVEIEVQLEEGSLRARITVVGTLSVLLGTYSFVANYKGFKESIVEPNQRNALRRLRGASAPVGWPRNRFWRARYLARGSAEPVA